MGAIFIANRHLVRYLFIPRIIHRGGCLELYYCNMVEWFWWDSSLIFDDQLVSFSALTLLVWPVKIVPEMTYYVSSRTLLTRILCISERTLTGARVLRRRRIVTPPSIMFSSESTARCSVNSATIKTSTTLDHATSRTLPVHVQIIGIINSNAFYFTANT